MRFKYYKINIHNGILKAHLVLHFQKMDIIHKIYVTQIL